MSDAVRQRLQDGGVTRVTRIVALVGEHLSSPIGTGPVSTGAVPSVTELLPWVARKHGAEIQAARGVVRQQEGRVAATPVGKSCRQPHRHGAGFGTRGPRRPAVVLVGAWGVDVQPQVVTGLDDSLAVGSYGAGPTSSGTR